MSIAKIVLIGSTKFLKTTLFELLKESDFDVTLFEGDLTDAKKLSDYDVIIVDDAFTSGKDEESFFKLLLSTTGFLIVDSKMSPEEILSRVNNIVYRKAGTKGLPIRSSPRITVNIDVEYVFQEKHYKSIIQTLSAKGAFITTLNPPPKGSRLKLSFSLPQGKNKIEAVGKVLYSIGYDLNRGIISHPASQDKKIIALPGMAVFFEEISEPDARSIMEFIEQNAA
jgi:hypothetical protein